MSSWFHRLRRKRVPGGPGAIAVADEPPAPPPCSPNRASYYVPSRDRNSAVPRRRAGDREDNPKLRDTRFPRSPQPTSDIVFDVVSRRDDGHRSSAAAAAAAAPELKLRPILTKPPPRPDVGGGGGSSAAASPTGRARPPPRLHAANKAGEAPPPEPDHHHQRKTETAVTCTRSRRQRRRRASGGGGGSGLRWVWESVVVVKESADPEEDFLESMAEMVAANAGGGGVGLEDLLACYLALNAADHHRAIVAAFRRAWVHFHLHRAPPPTPSPPTTPAEARGRRCMHEHQPCVVVVDR